MSARLGWARTASVPGGFLGMIVLVWCAESYVAGRASDFTPWGTWAWRQSGRAAWQNAPGCDVLCFGDSLVKLGVLPRVIEQRLGARTYNLSICAAQAPASYFVLRRALKAGARPRAVVVDFKPGMLAGGPRDFARNWPELLTLRECVELSWAAGDARFFASTTLALLVPSIRARHDIRINILLALQGNPGNLGPTTREYDRNWKSNAGGQATAPNPRFLGDVSAELKRKLLSHAFWCNRVNRVFVERFFTLAARHGIAVFLVLPPVAPELQHERDRSGAEAKHEQFVRGLLARHPNLTVVDGRRSGYDHRVMIDPIHLDRRGACTFTTDLADVMGQHGQHPAEAPRWVSLPPYRDVHTNLALDEIVDFNVAMGAQSRSRQ